MRLAFLLNSLDTGGAEIQTITLASRMRAMGGECLLVPLMPGEQIDVQGLEHVSPRGNRLTDRAAHRRTAAILDDFAPDVILTVNLRPASFAQLAFLAGARRRPVVTVYHSTLLLNTGERIRYAMGLPFARMSEVLVFVSENQRRHCERYGLTAPRVETIHNGVDLARFNPLERSRYRAAMRARLGLADHEFVIGMCAVFRQEKNHVQALAALRQLCRQGLPARLLLLGDGPLESVIRAEAAALGVADRVIFAGRQKDVVPWLAAFDVGLLTSTAVETFSLAALEFMAMGSPGILSDIGGASEMIDPGRTGALFQAGDTDALVAALAGLADPAVREAAGEAAARNVHARFSLDGMAIKYGELFNELVSEPA